MSHTPGPLQQPNVLHAPWEADGHAIFDAYSVMVASVGLASRTRDDAHEIARLIAAAPELLEALKQAVSNLKMAQILMDAPARSLCQSILRDYAAVIVKATGGAE